MNRKVVDLTTLYNFYKRLYSVFLNGFCTICCQTLNVAMSRWIGAAGSWSRFSSFFTQNLKCHSTWELCFSTNWTTFILVDFEVFMWNLENVAKVLEDIHWRQGLSRVRLCLWPRVDHKGMLTWSRGSIGFVGEVFEVMTQVDQGLTNVSRFDLANSVISVNDAN
jgi:hypothetical protein